MIGGKNGKTSLRKKLTIEEGIETKNVNQAIEIAEIETETKSLALGEIATTGGTGIEIGTAKETERGIIVTDRGNGIL